MDTMFQRLSDEEMKLFKPLFDFKNETKDNEYEFKIGANKKLIIEYSGSGHVDTCIDKNNVLTINFKKVGDLINMSMTIRRVDCSKVKEIKCKYC